jgi:guanylate kinase
MALIRQGLLLVVSGPSGVGKGTLIRRLETRHPELARSVSCTTREPRDGEVDGRDYHFISIAEFRRMAEADEFLEWAHVHGELCYGTPRKPVEEAVAGGRDIILEIDYQGARSVRQQLGGKAALVFVAPPSWRDLHERLVGRDTEDDASVQRRLRTARYEIAHMDLFQYVIVNANLDAAVTELEGVLVAERCRLTRGDWAGLRDGLLREAGSA